MDVVVSTLALSQSRAHLINRYPPKISLVEFFLARHTGERLGGRGPPDPAHINSAHTWLKFATDRIFRMGTDFRSPPAYRLI